MSRTLRRGQRGVAVSSSLALLSAAAVLLAGAAFVATGSPRHDDPVRVSAGVTRTATPSPPAAHPKAHKKKRVKKPVVHRGDTYVEVFNNSGISGLAGATAARAQDAGWQVVGSGNWYGAIATSTVYYPAAQRPAAELLAKDLGISRVKPLFAPMRGDRLTVILTTDYS
jgi:LytR cell envelope-related transcriptional attenuator